MSQSSTQEWKKLLQAMEDHAKEGAQLRKRLQKAVDRDAIQNVCAKIKKTKRL